MWGTNFSQFIASLVNLSPSKLHFTTKSEKELNVNNSLFCDTWTFMEHVYFPCSMLFPTLPPIHDSAAKIHSTMKSSELTMEAKWAGVNACVGTIPVLLWSLGGPVSWPTWSPSCSSLTKVTCTQYCLQLSPHVASIHQHIAYFMALLQGFLGTTPQGQTFLSGRYKR